MAEIRTPADVELAAALQAHKQLMDELRVKERDYTDEFPYKIPPAPRKPKPMPCSKMSNAQLMMSMSLTPKDKLEVIDEAFKPLPRRA